MAARAATVSASRSDPAAQALGSVWGSGWGSEWSFHNLRWFTHFASLEMMWGSLRSACTQQAAIHMQQWMILSAAKQLCALVIVLIKLELRAWFEK